MGRGRLATRGLVEQDCGVGGKRRVKVVDGRKSRHHVGEPLAPHYRPDQDRGRSWWVYIPQQFPHLREVPPPGPVDSPVRSCRVDEGSCPSVLGH